MSPQHTFLQKHSPSNRQTQYNHDNMYGQAPLLTASSTSRAAKSCTTTPHGPPHPMTLWPPPTRQHPQPSVMHPNTKSRPAPPPLRQGPSTTEGLTPGGPAIAPLMQAQAQSSAREHTTSNTAGGPCGVGKGEQPGPGGLAYPTQNPCGAATPRPHYRNPHPCPH